MAILPMGMCTKSMFMAVLGVVSLTQFQVDWLEDYGAKLLGSNKSHPLLEDG